jgi:aryl-alcohol dehydrogenase-like predicted oxidoreductase
MVLETAGRTEELIGRWMAERGNRDELVIATKAYFPMGAQPLHRGSSRLHLRRACEASRTRLRTDRIDLYLCHGWDSTVPPEETLGTLEDLRREGAIHYAGISNVRTHEMAHALVEARRLGVAGFQGIQPRYNVLFREAEESLLPLAQRFGLGTMVYNPLAGGILTGKYRAEGAPAAGTRFTLGDTGRVYRDRYWQEDLLRAAGTLAEAARRHGLPLVTAVIAWMRARPDVTSTIVGVSRLEQLDDQLRATPEMLPPDLRDMLDQAWFTLPRTPPQLDTPRIADFY